MQYRSFIFHSIIVLLLPRSLPLGSSRQAATAPPAHSMEEGQCPKCLQVARTDLQRVQPDLQTTTPLRAEVQFRHG